ncbi:hypothetical protein Tco_0277079 [Tanacetum coccineum]
MKSSRKFTDLTANTPYYSRPIRRIQDFDESKDHCLTLKNTSYPHQRYAVYNTLVNEEEPTGFTSIRRIHQGRYGVSMLILHKKPQRIKDPIHRIQDHLYAVSKLHGDDVDDGGVVVVRGMVMMMTVVAGCGCRRSGGAWRRLDMGIGYVVGIDGPGVGWLEQRLNYISGGDVFRVVVIGIIALLCIAVVEFNVVKLGYDHLCIGCGASISMIGCHLVVAAHGSGLWVGHSLDGLQIVRVDIMPGGARWLGEVGLFLIGFGRVDSESRIVVGSSGVGALHLRTGLRGGLCVSEQKNEMREIVSNCVLGEDDVEAVHGVEWCVVAALEVVVVVMWGSLHGDDV